MKLEKRGDDFELVLVEREKEIFLSILDLYPRTPADHHRLTETVASPELENTRKLLDESIKIGRKEARKKLDGWLAEDDRFVSLKERVRLKIKADEIEWLLQVLNEIRVGSWVRLGAPETDLEMTNITPKNAADFGVMSMSGFFVMLLLEAMRGEG